MAATHPLTAGARIAALAVALLGLAAAAHVPPAAAGGHGSLTLLRGKAGCLSAPTWRFKPGCTRIRGLRKPSTSPSAPTAATSTRARRSATRSPSSLAAPGTGCAAPAAWSRRLPEPGRQVRLRARARSSGSVRDRGERRRTECLRPGDRCDRGVQARPAHRSAAAAAGEGRLRRRSAAGAEQAGLRRRTRPGGPVRPRVESERSFSLRRVGVVRGELAVAGWDRDLPPRSADRATAQLPGAAGCVTALGRQRCGRARLMPQLGANEVVLDRSGGNLYVTTASGTFTGIIVFDRLRDGGLRRAARPGGCVSGGGAGGALRTGVRRGQWARGQPGGHSTTSTPPRASSCHPESATAPSSTC